MELESSNQIKNEFNRAIGDATVDFLLLSKTIASPESTGSTLIESCLGCQLELSWQAPFPGQWASPVSCPKCGRWYFTQGRNMTEPKVDIREKRNKKAWLTARHSRAPKAVEELLSRLIGDRPQVDERRQTIRYNVTGPVTGISMSHSGKMQAEAVALTLHNISADGVQVLAKGRWNPPMAVIDFTTLRCPGIQVIVKPRWHKTEHGCTKIGYEFMHSPDVQLPLV